VTRNHQAAKSHRLVFLSRRMERTGRKMKKRKELLFLFFYFERGIIIL